MSITVLWVSLANPQDASAVFGHALTQKHTIQAISRDGRHTISSNSSTVVALQVVTVGQNQKSVSDFMDSLDAHLTASRVQHYGIFLHSGQWVTWRPGNNLPAPEPAAKPEPAPEVKPDTEKTTIFDHLNRD